jgi:hypothetical protein
MKRTPEEIQATLARPGAGIPFWDRWLGRYFAKPWVLRRTPWAVSEKRFQRLHEKLKQELLQFPAEALTERVLIPPQRFLEDSSRYWSAAMVARHLTITGKQMEELVIKLSRNELIPGVADTGAVKPELERNDASSIEEYITFGDTLIERLRSGIQDQESTALFNHPWFGPMRAHEWMGVFALHTRIHLEQLRTIRNEISQ